MERSTIQSTGNDGEIRGYQQYKVQETMERLEAPVNNHISIKIARDYFRPFPQRIKG
jgi:hypothetical protein